MDKRLSAILETLLTNISVLNKEVERLCRSGGFSSSNASLQMIEQIRGECISSLQNLQTIEQTLNRKNLL